MVRWFIWRNLRPGQTLLSVGRTALLGHFNIENSLCSHERTERSGTESRADPHPDLSPVVQSLRYGCAVQDGILPAGGKQNRVGGSGEVPGPEAGRNRSLWDSVVSSRRKTLHFTAQRETICHQLIGRKGSSHVGLDKTFKFLYSIKCILTQNFMSVRDKVQCATTTLIQALSDWETTK